MEENTLTSINKFAGYGIAVAAALVAAIALLASTAYATVDSVTVSPDVANPGGTATVTIALSDLPNPADNASDTHTVNVFIQDPGAVWALSNDTSMACTITLTDDDDATDDATEADGEVPSAVCDGETVAGADISHDAAGEVDLVLRINVSSTATAGNIDILVDDPDAGTGSAVIAVAGDVAAGAAADIVVVSAPSSIANGAGEATITVRTVDSNDGGVNGVPLSAEATRGRLLQDGSGDCVTTGGTFADSDCDVTTSTISSVTGRARVVVQENGNVGQTTEVTFFKASPGPLVEQVSLAIVGQAASATIETEDTAAGGTSTITVTALDAEGNPVADDTDITVAASAGTVAACSNGTGTTGNTRDGVVTCTYVAPATAQSVVITAVVDVTTGSDIVTTGTLAVGGGTTPGAPGFTVPGGGSLPSSGPALVLFNGGTVAQLGASAQAVGALSVSLTVGGDWVVYIVGAPSFVNAEFNAAFPNGLAANAPVALLIPAS